jgi:hypothetical protein
MGGRHFTILYIVSKNRYRVLLTALVNSRANGFTFINIAYAINITKFFNLKIQPLTRLITTKGFNKQQGKPIIYILTLYLSLNSQRQEDIPFLILDLGNHDIILGLK